MHYRNFTEGTRAMENTEETEIDVEDIGTILKSGRLKSKKSLEDISSELCIRKIYLTALEESDYETLPPVPYGIGYVRTYAQYLGLSPDRAVKLYKAAFQTEEDAEEDLVSEPEANKSNKWHIIIGLLALAIVYSAWSLYTAKTSAEKMVDSDQEETLLNEDALAEEEENTIDSTEQPAKPDTVLPTEETKTEPSLTPDAEENTTTEDQASAIPQQGIYLSFSGDTWLELKDKNKVYMQGVFHNGQNKTVSYSKNMFISVGRPQNIKIYINGQEKNILVKKRKSNIPLDSL